MSTDFHYACFSTKGKILFIIKKLYMFFSYSYIVCLIASVLLEEYGRHMGRLAKTLFEAMVKNLNLGSEKSNYNLSESTAYVRIYRYPSFPETAEAVGMELHTDSSVLSILNPDEVGGLELLKDGKWFEVKPIPGTMIVNLGDMMQVSINSHSENLYVN